MGRIPNGLSLLRAGLAPLLVMCVWKNELLASAWIVGIALVTDMLDGWWARRYQCQTAFGAMMDPLADKGFALALFFSLAMTHRLPLWVACLVLARDVCLALGSVFLWIHGKTMLPPTWMSKANTGIQGLLGLSCLCSWPLVLWLMPLLVATTLGSSFLYAYRGWRVFQVSSKDVTK